MEHESHSRRAHGMPLEPLRRGPPDLLCTADGTATAGSDYQAASGTLTIPAGQTSGTITVLVNGDRIGEPNEKYFVNLSNLNYGVILYAHQGEGTIVDDEPRLSIGDVTKA